MGKVIDLTGQRFGRLVVVERAENSKRGQSRWRCQCDCGKGTVVSGSHLNQGTIQSCGCWGRERKSEANITHGDSKTRLFRIWRAMKWRCSPKSPRHKDYIDRGIEICDDWNQSFVTFRDWALSHGYADDLSIDRIDNDKGYSPENCRWISLKSQNRNRRSNHLITYQGKTQTVVEWAEELGIPATTLHQRIYRGWSDEDILTVPIGGKRLNPKA